MDYYKQFAPLCTLCRQPLLNNESIIRAERKLFYASDPRSSQKEEIYHQSCFACFSCKASIAPGDYYSHDPSRGSLLCKKDFFKIKNTIDTSQLLNYTGQSSENDWSASDKRQRTILTNDQRIRFQKVFDTTPRPSKKVRETLAQETGLSVRVIQVWFQNQRAREKKLQSMGLVSGDLYSQQQYNPDSDGRGPSEVSNDYSQGADTGDLYQTNRSIYNTNPLSPAHNFGLNPTL
ncbi:hypothetical protein Ciccas_010475 [Cichlidogyrus casuarinus]|uniref:Uncharacterized protein n=1 Tax=Cichlidogyrus casuarinus TaxID=1844966 RepID=A0ABD2PU23_9PLAT